MSNKKGAVFTAIYLIIFTMVYFALASMQLYTPKAQIIKIYYPVGLVLGMVAIVLMNKFFIKRKAGYIAISAVVLTLFLIVFTLAMDLFYRPILSDYYHRTPSSTLLGLVQYGNLKGNYMTIHMETLKEGIFAHSIAEGYSSQECRFSEVYNSPITYHVNQQYIIYDWNTERLINKRAEDVIAKEAYDYMIKTHHVPRERLNQFYFNGCVINLVVRDKQYGVFVYANNGEFAYSLNE